MTGLLLAFVLGGAGAAAAHDMTGQAHGHGVPTRLQPAPVGLGAHHLPLPVPTTIRLGVAPDGRFSIFVTPNVLTREQAIGLAAGRAARHCDSLRTGIPARIDTVVRHAYSSPESWGFLGTCR